VERWACDCNLTRVLMQDSVPIDVGRSQRTIKGPQRRALIARDKHCGWPGCERPASYCDDHHLRHWKDGGGLELDNMVLLCTTGWSTSAGGSSSRPKSRACLRLRRCSRSACRCREGLTRVASPPVAVELRCVVGADRAGAAQQPVVEPARPARTVVGHKQLLHQSFEL